jgi:hypothetical protein
MISNTQETTFSVRTACSPIRWDGRSPQNQRSQEWRFVGWMTGKPGDCEAGRCGGRNLRVKLADRTSHSRKRGRGQGKSVRSRTIGPGLQNLAVDVLFHQNRYSSVRRRIQGSGGSVFGRACQVEVPSGAAFGEAAQMRWSGEPTDTQKMGLRACQAGGRGFWSIRRMRIDPRIP